MFFEIINIFEIGKGAGKDYLALIIPLIISNINYGRTFIDIPSPDMFGEKLIEDIGEGHAINIKKRAVFIHPKSRIADMEQNYIKYLNFSNYDGFIREFKKTFQEKSNESIDGIVIIFVSLDTLIHEIGFKATLDFIEGLNRLAKVNNSVVLIGLKGFRKPPKSVMGMADTYWSIVREEDSLLFFGILPYTEMFHIYTDFSMGYPKVEAIPIM